MLKKLVPEAIKVFIRKLLRKIKFFRHKRQSKRYTREALAGDLRNLGIVQGDTVIVHSSLKNLGYVIGGPQTVIEALQDVIGDAGTLVFPAFTTPLSMLETVREKNRVFTINDPVTTGSIPETFRHLSGVVRSIHFTHSLAARGKHAEYITAGHYQQKLNFGKESPFGKLLELNAKVVGLGVNLGPVTFYHVFEDLFPELFPEVYLKENFSVHVDTGNEIVEVVQAVHNPEFHAGRIDKNPAIEKFFREHLERCGKLHGGKVGDGMGWVIASQDLISELETLYKNGKTIYRI
jgi:aminoglycoside 3-N-acetyltransferase